VVLQLLNRKLIVRIFSIPPLGCRGFSTIAKKFKVIDNTKKTGKDL